MSEESNCVGVRIVEDADAVSALTKATESNEYILFPAAVCPISPQKSVRISTGGPFKISVFFPGLEEDLSERRNPGLIYYLVWSGRYPNVGAFQVSARYPFIVPDAPILQMSLRILANTRANGTGARTNLFIPRGIGGGGFVREAIKIISESNYLRNTIVWTGNLGL